MRQTLFYIPHEIAGWPVFGAGWLLLVWTLVAAAYGVWLIVRGRWREELIGAVPFYLTVAVAIYWVLPWLEVAPFGLPIRGYGMMLLIAVLAGVGTAAYRAWQVGIEPDRIYSLALWMFLAGIFGARLFFVIQYWSTFQADSTLERLATIVKFTEGGLVVYGSLIGAIVAFVLFTRKHQLASLEIADIIAPSMVLGLAIGRIGCLMNGCCHGGYCEQGPLAITFPQYSAPEKKQLSPPYLDQLASGLMHGIRIGSAPNSQRPYIAYVIPGSVAERAGARVGMELRSLNGQPVNKLADSQTVLAAGGRELSMVTVDNEKLSWTAPTFPARSLPVHPAQLYSAFNALLIFLIGWFYFAFRSRPGEVFGIVLTIYPFTRFLMEWIRSDEPARFGTSLTISQLVSLVILTCMIAFWFAVFRRGNTLSTC